jgi:hypothetical protein
MRDELFYELVSQTDITVQQLFSKTLIFFITAMTGIVTAPREETAQKRRDDDTGFVTFCHHNGQNRINRFLKISLEATTTLPP